jgi:hypothetical protein
LVLLEGLVVLRENGTHAAISRDGLLFWEELNIEARRTRRAQRRAMVRVGEGVNKLHGAHAHIRPDLPGSESLR